MNLSLFWHKILGPAWNATQNPNFCISFLIFGPIFSAQKNSNCLLFVIVIINIIIIVIIIIVVIIVIIIIITIIIIIILILIIIIIIIIGTTCFLFKAINDLL